MATLRLKPRTTGSKEKEQEITSTVIDDKSPQHKGQVPKAAGAAQAPYGSLREYLKETH